MKTVIHKSHHRGHAEYGWLHTRYSFSFANYYNPDKMHFGALRVINDDIIEGGSGFDRHPHDNMEIVTMVLEGELEHRDSMGHVSIIKPGEVQVMSAGTGIYHSEYNHLEDTSLALFQIWIFPKDKNVKPSYGQKFYGDFFVKNEWLTMVTPCQEGTLHLNQDAWMSRIPLENKKETQYSIQLERNGAYVMVIDGEIEISGTHLQRRDAMGIWDTSSITIRALMDSDILLIEVPMNF